MTQPMLQVENIDVSYGAIHAVKNVSFHVDEGEIVTLIGANGAGKSTILKTISGLLRSKSGKIHFLNEDIGSVEAYRLTQMGLSHVPEGRRIFRELTVEENLEMGGYLRTREENAKTLEDVYEKFPRIQERRRQIAGTLSGGEQQMLALGRSLMSRPRLIMMDEPSMGLAPVLVEQIFDIIRELNETGTTILLVEQNAKMALSIACRGYVLETGKIALAANAQELLDNEDVKKAYLGG
ncbi:MAG: ABC transporter ATP-binding protein [Synergistaceae bacterium]|jgi:branched-chain amino acid transport system ATP-binding protein|nr:ABC transporter ATP-binding protein [Synergistaceae bacterium]